MIRQFLNKQVVMGVARHVLGYFGGVLTGAGLLDAASSSELQGALMVIVAVAWSAFEKRTP